MATGRAGVFQAVEDCKYWRLKYFVDTGISIHGRNQRGENVLVTALRIPDAKRRHRMFRWLLNLRVNPHNVDRVTGRDALLWAASLDRPTELRTILVDLEGELDLEMRDKSGRTALHYGVLNDSLYIVAILTRQMRKYGLPVDIPDYDGFTPYLLAVRLGHHECMRVLRQEGRASPCQFDTTSFRSTDHWASFGHVERQSRERDEQSRRIGIYKTFGRLPQLIAANYEIGKVKIVHSKNERTALLSSANRVGANSESRRQDDAISLPSLTPSREVSSLRSFDISVGTPAANTMRPTRDISSAVSFGPTLEIQDEDPGKSVGSSLTQFMSLLTDQQTGGYRTAAITPPGYVYESRPRDSISFATAAKVSAFAFKLKKKAQIGKQGSPKPRKQLSSSGQGKCPLVA